MFCQESYGDKIALRLQAYIFHNSCHNIIII
jgi:hypothetical protein